MSMSKQEAGRLGWIKSNAWRESRKQRYRDEYAKLNKTCLQCQKPIPYEKKECKFCSRSCRASFNNRGVRRHGKARARCGNCGKDTKRGAEKYCSVACQHEKQKETYIQAWLRGEKNGARANGEVIASPVKKYVLEKARGHCSICNGSEWMAKPMPLLVDHVDGDHTNNRPENLRAVCGNCDMQLPTYKGKNRGRGRAFRRQRYAVGKSF